MGELGDKNYKNAKWFSWKKTRGFGRCIGVQFEEKVSHFTSTTSRDPLLIAKCDEPKVEGKSHCADRIIKNIQIQTGAGKTKEEEVVAKQICSQLEADTTDTDSSISLDFDDQVVEASLDDKKRKKIDLETSFVTKKDNPSKKFKTYSNS